MQQNVILVSWQVPYKSTTRKNGEIWGGVELEGAINTNELFV